MDKNTLEINATLVEIKNDAKELFAIVETVNNSIKFIESQLEEHGLNFSFGLKVKQEPRPQESAVRIYSISWQEFDPQRKFRLLWTEEHKEYDDNKIVVRNTVLTHKPLIATKIHTKIEYSKYLPQFVLAFKNNLNKIKTEMQNALDEMK
jgi:hypothetical protein